MHCLAAAAEDNSYSCRVIAELLTHVWLFFRVVSYASDGLGEDVCRGGAGRLSLYPV